MDGSILRYLHAWTILNSRPKPIHGAGSVPSHLLLPSSEAFYSLFNYERYSFGALLGHGLRSIGIS